MFADLYCTAQAKSICSIYTLNSLEFVQVCLIWGPQPRGCLVTEVTSFSLPAASLSSLSKTSGCSEKSHVFLKAALRVISPPKWCWVGCFLASRDASLCMLYGEGVRVRARTHIHVCGRAGEMAKWQSVYYNGVRICIQIPHLFKTGYGSEYLQSQHHRDRQKASQSSDISKFQV